MRNKLLYAPVALALALAPATPADAGVCELVYLTTGDKAQVCFDSGSCLVSVATAGATPGVPNSFTCMPYPAGSPPYCNGVVGDVTVDTCVLDPSCTQTNVWVWVDPPGTAVCV